MQVEVRCYGAVRGAIGEKSIELDVEEAPLEAVFMQFYDDTGTETDGEDRDGDADEDGCPEEEDTDGDGLDALAARSESDFPTDAVVMRDRRHLDRETTIAGGDVVSVTDSPMPEG